MSIFRAVLAALIALSVALGPAAGGFAVASMTESPKAGPPSKSLETPQITELSAADCCDHDGMPVGSMNDKCQAAAGCAAKCFSLYGITFSAVVLPPDIGEPEPLMASQSLDSRTGTPPFRSPRA